MRFLWLTSFVLLISQSAPASNSKDCEPALRNQFQWLVGNWYGLEDHVWPQRKAISLQAGGGFISVNTVYDKGGTKVVSEGTIVVRPQGSKKATLTFYSKDGKAFLEANCTVGDETLECADGDEFSVSVYMSENQLIFDKVSTRLYRDNKHHILEMHLEVPGT